VVFELVRNFPQVITAEVTIAVDLTREVLAELATSVLTEALAPIDTTAWLVWTKRWVGSIFHIRIFTISSTLTPPVQAAWRRGLSSVLARSFDTEAHVVHASGRDAKGELFPGVLD